MEELLEQSNEVQESLSRSYAVPDEIDEADLEAGAYLFPLVRVLILTSRVERRVGRAGDG
jgi:charged multivesicular body protein 5